MPAPQATLAVRAAPAIAEPSIAAPEDDGVPNPRLLAVPPHEPWTDWPQPGPGPEAGGGQVSGPTAARAALADPAAEGHDGPRQFAVLLTEVLAGVRPVRQLRPWLSERGSVHLHRLMPLFDDGYRPRITRVLTTRPARDVIEMTLIVTVGPRTRALAVRLERIYPAGRPAAGEKLAVAAAAIPRSLTSARWHCTDIEAA